MDVVSVGENSHGSVPRWGEWSGDRIMMVVGGIWGELDVDEGDACVCLCTFLLFK